MNVSKRDSVEDIWQQLDFVIVINHKHIKFFNWKILGKNFCQLDIGFNRRAIHREIGGVGEGANAGGNVGLIRAGKDAWCHVGGVFWNTGWSLIPPCHSWITGWSLNPPCHSWIKMKPVSLILALEVKMRDVFRIIKFRGSEFVVLWRVSDDKSWMFRQMFVTKVAWNIQPMVIQCLCCDGGWETHQQGHQQWQAGNQQCCPYAVR